MDDTNRQHEPQGGIHVRRTGPVLFTLSDLRADKAVDSAPPQRVVAATDKVPRTDFVPAVLVEEPAASAQRGSSPQEPVAEPRRQFASGGKSKTSERTQRRPPPKPSLWSRIAASLFVLLLIGIAYLTFRGPSIPNSANHGQPPLLNMTGVAEPTEQDRWNDGSSNHLARSGVGNHGTDPADTLTTELDTKSSRNVSNSPTASHEGTTGDGAAPRVDEMTHSDEAEDTLSSPPLWNAPARPPSEWNQELGSTAADSASIGPALETSSPDSQSGVPGSATATNYPQVTLNVPQYPSTGYVAEIRPRRNAPGIHPARQLPAPRVATGPVSAPQRQFNGNPPGNGQTRPAASPSGSARLRGTIENPYIERNYEPGRSSLH